MPTAALSALCVGQNLLFVLCHWCKQWVGSWMWNARYRMLQLPKLQPRQGPGGALEAHSHYFEHMPHSLPLDTTNNNVRRQACLPAGAVSRQGGRAPSPARKHKTMACHATPGHALRAPPRFRFRFRVRPWPRPAQPPRRSAPGCPPAWTGAPRARRSARRAPAARCGSPTPPHARAPAPRSAAVPASSDVQRSTAQRIIT